MHSTALILLAAAIAGASPALAPADPVFVLRRGNDTIAVERFTRTAGRISGELLIKQGGLRFRYVADLDSEGRAVKVENKVWMATDSTGAAPRQSAVLTFEDAVAVVAIEGGGTQRIPTKTGVYAHINPSFALWEPMVAAAKRTGKDSFSAFTLSGGQTFDAKITFVGRDSALVDAPGGEVRLKVGPDGAILGGYIAAQGLTIERSEGTATEALRVEKPDYSAPAGAPYDAIDVTVPTPMGHTLAGTLTLPHGASASHRVPAVVTITGSGGQDRDEAIPLFKGFRPFREFADSLGRRGIAVLRMDDRGIGSSGGDPNTSTSADFAQDIRAGLAYLRTRPEIDGSHLALIGHSEGGIIAPMVALEEPTLAGIVLLAGTSRSGREILNFQLPNLIKGNPNLTPAQKDSALKEVPAQIDSMAAQRAWSKFFIQYEPLTTARKVKTPVLVLNGATDQQVTPDQVPELVSAFKRAGNKDVTSHVFPNLNHLFVYDPSGFPGGYTQLESFKVDPGVITMVADWLAKRLIPGTS